MLGTWEDPPEGTERNKKWDQTFRELEQNPGRWAKLYAGKDRNAHSLAGRLRKNYPTHEIKSQTLAPDDDGERQAGVWARYHATPDILEALEEVNAGDTTVAMSTEEFADQLTEMTGSDPYGHLTEGGSADLDG